MKSQYLINNYVQVLIVVVARELNVNPERMMSYTRSESRLIGGRQLVMWVARTAFNLNWAQLARATLRDHTTTLYGVRKFGILMGEDPFWRNLAYHFLELVQTDDYRAEVNKLSSQNIKQVPLFRKPKITRVSRKDKNHEFTEVAWVDRHGIHGSTREYFETQNERFSTHMREALQDPETPDTNES